MTLGRRKNSVIGYIAGLFSDVFGAKPEKPVVKDLKAVDFTTSAQRIGVRFTERIRDVFRFKWIK